MQGHLVGLMTTDRNLMETHHAGHNGHLCLISFNSDAKAALIQRLRFPPFLFFRCCYFFVAAAAARRRDGSDSEPAP